MNNIFRSNPTLLCVEYKINELSNIVCLNEFSVSHTLIFATICLPTVSPVVLFLFQLFGGWSLNYDVG